AVCLEDRRARRHPTYHHPPPRLGEVPESHSPWLAVVYAVASMRSRSRRDRADAEQTERIRHACRWSSNMPPRTNGSAESSSDEESFPPSAKPGADTWRTDSVAGSPNH